MSDLRLLHTLGVSQASGAGELFVRHARKDGHSVAILRAYADGDGVLVHCEVSSRGADGTISPGPFRFPDAQQAMAFAVETVEALMYLGCEIQTQ